MTISSQTSPPAHRLLHGRLLPVGLLLLAVAAALLSLVVDHDGTDTALGAVTGACSVLLLFVLFVQVLGVRARRVERDRGRLDGLEPLRAARRGPGHDPRP